MGKRNSVAPDGTPTLSGAVQSLPTNNTDPVEEMRYIPDGGGGSTKNANG
jgi:hypothetical protein